jgi:nitrogen fixation protein NifU and related proteins
MNISSDLYQQTLLDYNRDPRNFGKLPDATHTARGLNPLCGDDYTVYLRVNEDDVIESASFDGHGCAVSKASASMMTEQIVGRTLEQAAELYDCFRNLALKGETPADSAALPSGLLIFSGVWKFPERVKCAVLGWHALKGALKGEKTVSTE